MISEYSGNPARVRRREGRDVFLRMDGDLAHALGEVADGGVVHDDLRNHDGKGRAFAVDALQADRAAHQVEQHMGDGEAEARAFDIAVLLLVEALEIAEQLLLVLLLDADSGIVDDEGQIDVVLLLALVEHIEIDLARGRVFDRIRQDIDDDLLDAHHVA